MLKKSLAAALGAMLMAGTAGAVEVSQGGKGDLLIAPLYMVDGGWTTEFKVINTNAADSAVAKVVFHDPVLSAELLDFLIYLSPGDVWTGVLSKNADGSIGVSSSDPSSILSANNAQNCPSTTNASSGLDPKEAVFKNTNGVLTNPPTTGYVVVTQARMVRGLGNAPVAKSAVLGEYSRLCSLAGRDPAATITAVDTDNVLTGSTTLVNPQNGNKLSLPMTALSNYDNLDYLKVGQLTSFAASNAVSSKQDVEDALWATDFVVPFNSDNQAGYLTYANVTFPTKETYNGSIGTKYTHFWNNQTRVPVTYTVRNEEEEILGVVGCRVSPCPEIAANALYDESNLVGFSAGGSIASSTALQVNTERFTKGWVNMAIGPLPVNQAQPNQNLGAPALVTYINWDGSSGSLQGTWQYAPKTVVAP